MVGGGPLGAPPYILNNSPFPELSFVGPGPTEEFFGLNYGAQPRELGSCSRVRPPTVMGGSLIAGHPTFCHPAETQTTEAGSPTSRWVVSALWGITEVLQGVGAQPVRLLAEVPTLALCSCPRDNVDAG